MEDGIVSIVRFLDTVGSIVIIVSVPLNVAFVTLNTPLFLVVVATRIVPGSLADKVSNVVIVVKFDD